MQEIDPQGNVLNTYVGHSEQITKLLSEKLDEHMQENHYVIANFPTQDQEFEAWGIKFRIYFSDAIRGKIHVKVIDLHDLAFPLPDPGFVFTVNGLTFEVYFVDKKRSRLQGKIPNMTEVKHGE